MRPNTNTPLYPGRRGASGTCAFDILVVVFTLAVGLVAIYVGVGIVLLPVWAAGAALRVPLLRRVAGGWWELPVTAAEAFDSVVSRVTAPRDGSRWKLPQTSTTNQDDGDWTRGLGKLVLWVLALVGGLLMVIYGNEFVIDPIAGGSVAEPVVALLIFLTLCAGVTVWLLGERYKRDERPPLHRLMMALTVLGIAVSYFTLTGIQHAHRLVADYCSYGSVSQAQLDGCESHVTGNEVESRATRAARFAQSGSDAVCGAQSGPFCDDVISRRLYEDQAPPPGQ